MEEFEQEERRIQRQETAENRQNALIDGFIKDMTVDAIQDAIEGDADILASLWILNRKDEKKRNQLIIQQIESAMLNKAESEMEEYL